MFRGDHCSKSNVDAFSLQEVNSRITNFLSDLAFDDPWSIFFMTVLSPLGYIKGNKGGVTVRMSLYGHTICFINCHLPAHMENTEQRLDDFEKILEMQFEEENIPSTLDHDVLFWFGDLNFRIADYGIHFVRESINNKRFNLLWEKDQLNMAKKKEAFLQEFIEGPLQFKPTYKFDLHSDVYDTSEKKRKPAWTDRILWRVKSLCQRASKEDEFSEEEQTISVTLNNYISHMSYGISDHKPVTGTFGLELKPLLSEPLVTLSPEGEWSAEHDVLLSYSAVPGFPSSAWDWIGLFKVTLPHCGSLVKMVNMIGEKIKDICVPQKCFALKSEIINMYLAPLSFPCDVFCFLQKADALYLPSQVTFRHANDYVTYAWVEDDEISSNKDSKQVYMSAAEIPDVGGEFLLGYYSNNLQSIVGISQPFQVIYLEALII
ncbi:UNVERIFIED_CONTAM: hypothetical protein H355_008215 [Colinus virginianus]|nr:hypothetical protein H355_008215 [Colinus virginianus]